MKICTRCGIDKPLDDFGQLTTHGRKYPTGRCRECRRVMERQRWAEDPEYRSKKLAAHDRWRRANPAKHLVNGARYRKKYPDKNKARAQRYYATHRDELLTQRKVIRDADYETYRAYHAAYRAAHPQERLASHSRRRARLMGNGGGHTAAEWLAVVAAYNNCCAYCGVAGRMTRDHVVPLLLGGSDNIDNILPACARCNARKRAKPLDEFLAWLKAAA